MSKIEIKPEELERLYELVSSIEVQLANIGEHYPNALGRALLASTTFLIEKIYLCSRDAQAAGLLLAAAQEAGLQNWIDAVEQARNQEEPLIQVDSH